MNAQPHRQRSRSRTEPAAQRGKSRGIQDAARWCAYEVCRAIDSGKSWERAWHEVEAKPPRYSLDRYFAQELTSGVVRLRRRLDHPIAHHVGCDVQKLDSEVRTILRLGVYQLLQMDRVPAYAAVNSCVDLAKAVRPRAAKLVNAVLRNIQRTPLDPPGASDTTSLAVRHSHPDWLVARWLERFGANDCERLLEYDNRRPHLCLRVQGGAQVRADLMRRYPDARAGRWAASSLRFEKVHFAEVADLVQNGAASVQDESATYVVELAGAAPGEAWLDLAAAPGGKAGHLAECVGRSGSVLAVDVDARKVGRIEETARRLHLPQLVPRIADGRSLRAGAFDGVLLDAPCTGLGVLARRPDARWRKKPEDLPRLAALQKELLENAWRHVRPGGKLVYSVCSFEPEETTEVAAWFEARHAAAEPRKLPGALPVDPGKVYFLPQETGTDGGFVGIWEKGPP